jgi:hypothetical protein
MGDDIRHLVSAREHGDGGIQEDMWPSNHLQLWSGREDPS